MKRKSSTNKVKKGEWDEDRYREKLYTLLSRSANGANYKRARIARNFDYFYGRGKNDEYDNLLTLHETGENDGNTPFVPINADSISPKFQLLLGELRERGFEVSVSACNTEAIKRRNAYERMLKAQMEMQAFYEKAAQATGVEYGLNQNLPEDEQSLAEYMDSYRDLFEELMEEAISYNVDLYKYKFLRKNLFLDLLITNEVHIKAEIRNGYPQFRRVNPLNCLWDSSSEDDYQSDSSFFMEAYYMSIPDAIEKYDLKQEDVEQMIEYYENGSNSSWNGVGVGTLTAWSPFLNENNGSGVYQYDRILVVEAEFLDIEKKSKKVTYDSYDNIHVHEYSGKDKNAKLTGKYKDDPRSSLDKKEIQIVRKATLIGGSFITNTGVCPNLVRSYANPETTKLNYISVVHNYNNQESVSLMERLTGLQDFKNYVLTILQKEVTTNVGSAIAIDTSKIDSDIYGVGKEALSNILHNLKAYRIIAYNSMQDGMPSNTVPIQNIQPRTQQVVQECLGIIAYLDSEIEKVGGINESRQGQGGERQLASVTAQRVGASQMATDSYFDAFRGLEVRLYERHAQQIAMTWVRNPKLYDNIAARLGVAIPEDFAIDLQDYRAFIRALPMPKRKVLQIAEQAVLANNLPFTDFTEILLDFHKDPNRGIRTWLNKARKREADIQKMQQQQMEQQAQAQQAQQQAQQQADLAKIQAQNQGKIAVADRQAGGQQEMNKLSLMQKDRSDTTKLMADRERARNESQESSQ